MKLFEDILNLLINNIQKFLYVDLWENFSKFIEQNKKL